MLSTSKQRIMTISEDSLLLERVSKVLGERYSADARTPEEFSEDSDALDAYDLLILDTDACPGDYLKFRRSLPILLLISEAFDATKLSYGNTYHFPKEDWANLCSYVRYIIRQSLRATTEKRIVRPTERLESRLQRLVAYIWGICIVGCIWLMVRILLSFQINGLEQLRKARKNGKSILLVGNHQRELDPLVTIYSWAYWRGIFSGFYRPRYIVGGAVWSKSILLRAIGYLFFAYPVHPQHGLHQWGLLKFIQTMRSRQGIYVIFPEGAPSEESVEAARSVQPGVGFLAYHTGATVIPFYSQGQRAVFPSDFSFPRPFKRIRITFGEPVDVSAFRRQTASAATYDRLSQHIFAELRALEGRQTTKQD